MMFFIFKQLFNTDVTLPISTKNVEIYRNYKLDPNKVIDEQELEDFAFDHIKNRIRPVL